MGEEKACVIRAPQSHLRFSKNTVDCTHVVWADLDKVGASAKISILAIIVSEGFSCMLLAEEIIYKIDRC